MWFNLWILFSYLSGQSPAVAEFNLLDIARKVDLYGIQMHPAKVKLFEPF